METSEIVDCVCKILADVNLAVKEGYFVDHLHQDSSITQLYASARYRDGARMDGGVQEGSSITLYTEAPLI